MQIDINSPILQNISSVYENRENIFRQADSFTQFEPDLAAIANFFGLDNKTAALLAVVICEHLMGETNSFNRIMKTLGFAPVDFILINNSITGMRKKGWIKMVNKLNRRGNSNGFMIANEVIDAVITNDPLKLVVTIPENLMETLLGIRSVIKNMADHFSHTWKEELLSELERFDYYPFIGKLLNNSDLTEIEKFIVLLFSAEFLNGREEFDLNSTFEELACDSAECNFIIRKIKDEKIALMRDGYVQFVNPCLADFSSVTLGERILAEIGLDIPKKEKAKFVSKYSVLLDPAETPEQVMFFNADNEISINEIIKFTAPESFSEMEERFTNSGMKPGLTMLFYGLPGTGKTELVKQIGRVHQRPVMLVEIAAIKSMWVGESEKNLKKLFMEYKAALKHYETTPILFFNEADGILGERRHAQTAVDQMLNSMQNIILQELEDFQGIFIATTNLVTNIDRAFDRRMLYKLNFQLPNDETRLKILNHEFPAIPEALLKEISRKYTLSGGQIQNIRKKFLVDNILFPETSDHAGRLLRHVEEETRFRTRKGRAIGFRINDLTSN